MDHRNDEQWRRREWDGPPESVAVDEMGYQSGGALSDGPNYSGYTHNSNYAMRSSGSVGSHGSGGERHAAYLRQPIRDLLPQHVMNGETRFPTAFSYAASAGAQSDIATVCSGSVTEDIEVASVLSADYNVAQIPNNLLSSPPSSERSALTRNRRSASGGRVEFAALTSTIGFAGNAFGRQSAQSQDSSMTVQHDMGPPLSRALLLQHPPSHGSQAGSVRSFGSTIGAGSDVAPHVDTDDCGGSFTDGQSVHSQEDHAAGLKVDDGDEEGGASAGEQPADDHGSQSAAHPLGAGNSSSVPTNGRVSPGGTVYKGRGVRRYQGRYMNLPLKRFHQQNGVDLCGGYSDECYSREDYERHEYNGFHARRRQSPRHWNENDRRRSPSPARYDENDHRRKRSRSRSPASNNRSRTPPRRNRRNRNRSWRSRSPTSSRGRDRYEYSRRDRSHRQSPSRQRRRSRNGARNSSSL